MKQYEVLILTKFYRYLYVMADNAEDAKAQAQKMMAEGLDPVEEADIERRVFADEKE